MSGYVAVGGDQEGVVGLGRKHILEKFHVIVSVNDADYLVTILDGRRHGNHSAAGGFAHVDI